MNHQDHVDLLRKGVPAPGGVWADFGSGRGAFTLALAELIGPGGQIYSIDKDRVALREQERLISSRFPEREAGMTRTLAADFTRPLDLPPLDGAVMANSLHFHKDKLAILRLIRGYLRSGGRLLLVEYNVDRGNLWVPHPLSFRTWEKLAAQAGFEKTRLLAARPSRFLGEIFAAESVYTTHPPWGISAT
jgi:SAM-dependent methyltransferase